MGSLESFEGWSNLRIALFYHSLISDWNHGNAHFLRGISSELLRRGHELRIYEPRDSWSLRNLVAEHGAAPIELFHRAYPQLKSIFYDLAELDLERALDGCDLVLVHEWNDHELVRRIGKHRLQHRDCRVLFHDTHHRSVTAADSMAAYDLSGFDGVLAFGEVIRDIYLRKGWAQRAWTWHEAADIHIFRPLPPRDVDTHRNVDSSVGGVDTHDAFAPSLASPPDRAPNLDTHRLALGLASDLSDLDTHGLVDATAKLDGELDTHFAGNAHTDVASSSAADAAVDTHEPRRLLDDEATPENDLVWIGNWGDDERALELHEFLLNPVRQLRLKARTHGVRYPEQARRALAESGIEYRGWLPNFEAPQVFATFRATVHVPRRPYVEALPGIPTIRVFEALACGIPLICSPWDDAERLFSPGSDYLVASTGEKMTALLRMILSEPRAAHEVAERGRKTILRKHTCAHRVDQLLRIYDELTLETRKGEAFTCRRV